MQNIASYLLSNAFSAFSPIMNTASAICSVNGQQIPCDDQLSGALGIGMGVFFLIMLVLVVLIIVGTWKVYKKAGEPGWACIIPIYNIIVLLQIVKKPIWWIVLFFIPIVNVIMSIVVMHNLSKSFGKDVGYTLGLIFLPFIFYPILGFGSAQYVGGMTASTPTGAGAPTQTM